MSEKMPMPKRNENNEEDLEKQNEERIENLFDNLEECEEVVNNISISWELAIEHAKNQEETIELKKKMKFDKDLIKAEEKLRNAEFAVSEELRKNIGRISKLLVNHDVGVSGRDNVKRVMGELSFLESYLKPRKEK